MNDKWILSLKPIGNDQIWDEIKKDISINLSDDRKYMIELYNFFVKVIYMWDLAYTYELDLLFINLVNKKDIKLKQTTKNAQYIIALIMRAKKINLDVIFIQYDDTLILVNYETQIKEYNKYIPLLNYFNWTVLYSQKIREVEEEIFCIGRLRLLYNDMFHRFNKLYFSQ